MASGGGGHGEGGRRLELFIETLTGTAFELQASPLETIMAIKTKIQHLEGIPVCQQHLIWGSQELRDEWSLKDCRVRDGATLRLVLGMRGGPLNARSAVRGADAKSSLVEAELLDNERDDLLQASEGRPLTVVVFHDGDQVHWYTVIQDDNLRSHVQSPSLSWLISRVYEDVTAPELTEVNVVESDPESEREMSAGRITEDRLMRQKVAALQKQLRAMGLNKKNNRRKAPVSSSASIGGMTSTSERRESGSGSFLPPLTSSVPSRADSRGKGHHSSGCPTPLVNRLPAIHSASNRRQRMRDTPPALLDSPTPLVRQGIRQTLLRPACNPRRRPSSPLRHPALTEKDEDERSTFLPRLKLVRHFASEAGTPTTASGQRKLDRWLNKGRPRTTPSKFDIDLDGRTVSLSRLVSEVGSWRGSSRNSGTVGVGTLVAAGRNSRTGSGKKRTQVDSETTLRDVVPDTGEDGAEDSRLPPIRAKKKKKKSKRCTWCNKKTGLASSYVCRCGKNYCASHRYPEVHHCTHNFKAEGRRLLQLSHPLVAAPKLPKI